MAIPAPYFTTHPDQAGSTLSGTDPAIKVATIYGAVVVIDGSGSYADHEIEQEVTESVVNTVYVATSEGPVPMRLGMSKGAHNLRSQSSGSSYYISKSTTTST
jgi:hypothetical protein